MLGTVWKGPWKGEEPSLWAASLGGGQVRGKNSPGLVRAGRQVGSGSVCVWRG